MTVGDDASDVTRGSGLQSFDDFELTLGDVMRGERATMGKSLLDVQRDIKIKAEYLAAIEDTDLAAFETPGFIGGYVKSYARYLGMNPDWVHRRFCDESGFSHVAGLDAQVYATKTASGAKTSRATKVARASDNSDSILSRSPLYAAQSPGLFAGVEPSAVGSLAVLAALIMGLGYGGWTVLQQIQKVQLAPVETAIVADPVAEEPLTDSLIADNSAPTPEALDRLYRPQALERPILVPRDGPIANLDPAGQGVYAEYEAPDISVGGVPVPVPQPDPLEMFAGFGPVIGEDPVSAVVQVVEARPPEVVIFARRPVWLRIRASDRTVLLEKILEPGERYVLPETETPPTLRAGNSGSLFFAVNGETLGPAGPGTSVAKNVVLSAVSLAEVYEKADLAQDPELARLAELVMAPEEPSPETDE